MRGASQLRLRCPVSGVSFVRLSSSLVYGSVTDHGGGFFGSEYEQHCSNFSKEIEALAERHGMDNFEEFLKKRSAVPECVDFSHILPPHEPRGGYKHLMTPEEINLTLDAAMATFCLHVESRIAALVGKGFYTIGPCGEEMLSSIGLALKDYDDVALHYRHLGVSLTRNLQRKGRSSDSMRQLLLDRARGYTVSKQDPVTGGVHCSIGNHQGPGKDYLVTSTLASQCPPATGRALGYALAAQQGQGLRARGDKPVSMVTLGDGKKYSMVC